MFWKLRLGVSVLAGLMLALSLTGQWAWTQAMVLGVAETGASPRQTDVSASVLTPVTPDYVAHGYVRSLYAADEALARELYPEHSAGSFGTERTVTLRDSFVSQLTPEQAGIDDPPSGQLYFRVTTWVTRGPLHGQGDYLVMLRPLPDAPKVLKVGQIHGGIVWQE